MNSGGTTASESSASDESRRNSTANIAASVSTAVLRPKNPLMTRSCTQYASASSRYTESAVRVTMW